MNQKLSRIVYAICAIAFVILAVTEASSMGICAALFFISISGHGILLFKEK